MERPYEVVTFDCYGTLIDWEEGIASAFAALPGAAGRRGEILTAYAEIEPEVEAAEYRRYRAVLAETARRVAERLGLELPAKGGSFLAESLPHWRPFSDSNAALERLRDAGYSLGIISNVDDELLAATRRHLAVELELVVTAEQVGAYKPAHDPFFEARKRIGARPWLHAAQSFFHDVEPARALGIAVAWVNRKGESHPGGASPDREFRDLTELADWLA